MTVLLGVCHRANPTAGDDHAAFGNGGAALGIAVEMQMKYPTGVVFLALAVAENLVSDKAGLATFGIELDLFGSVSV